MPIRPLRAQISRALVSRTLFAGSIVAIALLAAVATIEDGAQVRTSSATTAASTTASTNSSPVATTAPRPSAPSSSPIVTASPSPPSAGTPAAASESPSFSATDATASTLISGTEKVYVSALSTTPQTSDDVNPAVTQTQAQTLITQLNSYWSAQSNGAVTIQLGGFETRSLGESSCDPVAALSAEESDAFGGLFANDAWKGTHDHLLVLSSESCNSDSFATVGGTGGEIFSGNGVGTAMGVPYLLHEFGHNLGFEHADASICTNTTSDDGEAADFSFTSTVCPTREYDDYFDIMGYTVKNATPNLSSPQRILAGWLPNHANITTTTTTTLTALGGSGGTQALTIVDPNSGDLYYVEYRIDSGLDATSAEFNYGLQCDPAMSGYTICELDSNRTTGDIRVLRVVPFPAADANGTTVLATGLTAGSTDATRRHTHLNGGDSFTNVDGAFTIHVVSMSPTSGAVVSVTFSRPTRAPTPRVTTVPAPATLP